MTVSPTPAPSDDGKPSKLKYDWWAIQPGQWQRWLDLDPDRVSDDDALRACIRVRMAAKSHAKRHGLTVKSRQRQRGHILDLMFTTCDESGEQG